MAQNGLSENTLSSLQTGWLLHKQFIAWVNEGGDDKEMARKREVESKTVAARMPQILALDAKLAAEEAAKNQAAFGAKV